MSGLKTKETNSSVKDFIDKVEDPQKRADSYTLLELMQQITNEKPVLWGSSIVGFGKYHYKSERSSQEGDWPIVGFSPRKQSLSLYVLSGFEEQNVLLQKLGKHKTGVGCLYINKLEDIDKKVLEQLIKKSFVHMKSLHQTIQ